MNMVNVQSDIESIICNSTEFGINQFHADFMDGHFVPRIGISPELIRDIKSTFPQVSIDSHLMVEDPYTYVDIIAPYSDWITYHYEAVTDPIRTLQKIRRNWPNIKVALAFNLATPFNKEMIRLFDGVMFMGISPGVLGTNSYPIIVKDKIKQLNYNMPYFIDGSVNLDTIPLYNMINPNGTFICGSSTIFKVNAYTKGLNRDKLIAYNIDKLKGVLK